MTIHIVEKIVDTNTLNKFIGKIVEIHTTYKRFLGQLESVSTDQIIVSSTGKYDKARYGNMIILSDPIISIREIIPESHLTKEECQTKQYYKSSSDDMDHMDECEDVG